jgi:DNA repair photolyase
MPKQPVGGAMSDSPKTRFIGRGSASQPTNRFEHVSSEADFEHLADDDVLLAAERRIATEYLADQSQTIVASNDSPDVGFNYSVNPYRGCSHGCSYCYARPSHEYLGMSAGLDFETKVLVKHDAARLFREFLAKRSWKCETIVFSGVTDCYQPAERDFKLTRQCLAVALECRQPIAIITKNALVVRDLDILSEMARSDLIHVSLSITTLDADLARTLEPRTSTPAAKLRAMRALTAAGVPSKVMVAPVIPGLNDSEIPAILQAATEAGASSAGYVLLRLPHAVKPLFLEWLDQHRPLARAKVEQLIRSMRGGKLYVTRWGERQRGTGAVAEQIGTMFRTFKRLHGLDGDDRPLDCTQFNRPALPGDQLRLF